MKINFTAIYLIYYKNEKFVIIILMIRKLKLFTECFYGYLDHRQKLMTFSFLLFYNLRIIHNICF